MNPWPQSLREGAITGTLGSLLSLAALVIAGRYENGRAAAPLNAISHWVWDYEALRQSRPSLRYTMLGSTIHHGAAMLWGVLHARAWGHRAEHKRLVPAMAGGAVAATVAAAVDLLCAPQRLTPGFERQLSRTALVGVYASFGLGIALASMAMARRSHPRG